MSAATRERLFGFHHAFDSPVTLWITVAVAAVLFIAALIVWLLHAVGKTSAALHDELAKRVISWAVMAPLLLGPVLLGAAWTILGVGILSVLCYREFARATGFFRQRSLSFIVVLGIIGAGERDHVSDLAGDDAHLSGGGASLEDKRSGKFARASAVCPRRQSRQPSRCGCPWSDSAIAVGGQRFSHRGRRHFFHQAFLLNLCHGLDECAADLAKKLRSAFFGRIAGATASRRKRLHSISGRNAHARWHNGEIQAGTGATGRRNEGANRSVLLKRNFRVATCDSKFPVSEKGQSRDWIAARICRCQQ